MVAGHLRAEARNQQSSYLSSQWLAEIQVVVERHLALVVRRKTVGGEISTVDNHRSWVASGACLLVEEGLARNMLQLPSSLLLGFASAVKSSLRQCLFVLDEHRCLDLYMWLWRVKSSVYRL